LRKAAVRPWKYSRVLYAAAHHAHAALAHLVVAHADGGLHGGFLPDPGVAVERTGAREQAGDGQRDRPAAVERRQLRRVHGGEGGGKTEARGGAEQEVVGQGQRTGPFLQELDRGIDHRGAGEQRDGGDDAERADTERDLAGDAKAVQVGIRCRAS
jgi:hypothetical protein